MGKVDRALRLKRGLRIAAGKRIRAKDYKIQGSYNAGYGYWFPEYIKIRGEHHDYYNEAFTACVSFLINNLEELLDSAQREARDEKE